MQRYTELKERVSSLQNLEQIVSALRSLAAVRLQEARASLAGIRTYVTHIDASLRYARQLAPTEQWSTVSGQDTLVVAFLSEHGFVGGLNSKVLNHVVREAPGETDRLIIVGTRGATLAEELGFKLHAKLAAPSHASGALPLAHRLADHVYEFLATGRIGRLLLCYPRPIFDAEWEAVTRTLLPFSRDQQEKIEVKGPPLLQMPREHLLTALIDEWLFAEIMQAEMEAFAAENGARLMTMEAVHANVSNKVSSLEQETRIVRQEDITTELLDIMVGAESVLTGSAADHALQ